MSNPSSEFAGVQYIPNSNPAFDHTELHQTPPPYQPSQPPTLYQPSQPPTPYQPSQPPTPCQPSQPPTPYQPSAQSPGQYTAVTKDHGLTSGPQDQSGNVVVITQPGLTMPPPQPHTRVPYIPGLVLSIISIIFCICCGIPGIVLACKAKQLKDFGQYQDARKTAMRSIMIAIVGIVLGGAITVAYNLSG